MTPPRRQSVGYNGAHRRLYRLFGSAAEDRCVRCHQPANDWAYRGGDPNEQHDARGCAYSLNPDFYQAMCRSCHLRMDRGRRRAVVPA